MEQGDPKASKTDVAMRTEETQTDKGTMAM